MVSNLFLRLSLNLHSLLSTLSCEIFLFLFSYHYFEHIVFDELVVMYKFSLHQGYPFVLGGGQILDDYFPEQGSDWIKLKYNAVAIGSVMLYYVIFIHIFVHFLYTSIEICIFIYQYILTCFVK